MSSKMAQAAAQTIDDMVSSVNWDGRDEREEFARIIDGAFAPVLDVTKELRDALAGALRVITDHGGVAMVNQFVEEMSRVGVKPGIGVRADAMLRTEARA